MGQTKTKRGVRLNVFVNDVIENVSASEIRAILTEAGFDVEAVNVRLIGEKEWDHNVNGGSLPRYKGFD